MNTDKQVKLYNRIRVLTFGRGGGRIGDHCAETTEKRFRHVDAYMRSNIGYIAFDTDLRALTDIKTRSVKTHLLGEKIAKGEGAGRGDVAVKAFEEDKELVIREMAPADILFIIATLSKNTGFECALPAARLGNSLGKVVFSVLVRPALEDGIPRWKVEAAQDLEDRFIDEGFRIITILNDAAYKKRAKMDAAYISLNPGIANTIAGMILMASSPEADPNDFRENICKGGGRLSVGHAELPLAVFDDKWEEAIQACNTNYCIQYPLPSRGAIRIIQGDLWNDQKGKLNVAFEEHRENTVREFKPVNVFFDAPGSDMVYLTQIWADVGREKIAEKDIYRPVRFPGAIAAPGLLGLSDRPGGQPIMSTETEKWSAQTEFKALRDLITAALHDSKAAWDRLNGDPDPNLCSTVEVIANLDLLEKLAIPPRWNDSFVESLRSGRKLVECTFPAPPGSPRPMAILARDTPIDVLEKVEALPNTPDEVRQEVQYRLKIGKVFGLEALARMEAGAAAAAQNSTRGQRFLDNVANGWPVKKIFGGKKAG